MYLRKTNLLVNDLREDTVSGKKSSSTLWMSVSITNLLIVLLMVWRYVVHFKRMQNNYSAK
jgi:hypothetical protein